MSTQNTICSLFLRQACMKHSAWLRPVRMWPCLYQIYGWDFPSQTNHTSYALQSTSQLVYSSVSLIPTSCHKKCMLRDGIDYYALYAQLSKLASACSLCWFSMLTDLIRRELIQISCTKNRAKHGCPCHCRRGGIALIQKTLGPTQQHDGNTRQHHKILAIVCGKLYQKSAVYGRS